MNTEYMQEKTLNKHYTFNIDNTEQGTERTEGLSTQGLFTEQETGV